jgi:pyrroloquinoline-quinone synthase
MPERTKVGENQPPLTADAFETALRKSYDRYWHKHPFEDQLVQGKLTRPQIQGWVANRYYYQKSMPLKDAAILSNCPIVEVRRQWLQRIVYQDGSAEGQGGLEGWLRLAEAVGLSRKDVLAEKDVVPGVRFAVEAYVTFARTSPWIESVAASLSELYSPDLMKERLAAFAKYYPWIDASGYAYFNSRSQQARIDSHYALDLVKQYCLTRFEQERAMAALYFKCDVLWSMLDNIQHAYGIG